MQPEEIENLEIGFYWVKTIEDLPYQKSEWVVSFDNLNEGSWQEFGGETDTDHLYQEFGEKIICPYKP